MRSISALVRGLFGSSNPNLFRFSKESPGGSALVRGQIHGDGNLATGLPARATVMRSPFSTRASSFEKCVLAISWIADYPLGHGSMLAHSVSPLKQTRRRSHPRLYGSTTTRPGNCRAKIRSVAQSRALKTKSESTNQEMSAIGRFACGPCVASVGHAEPKRWCACRLV